MEHLSRKGKQNRMIRRMSGDKHGTEKMLLHRLAKGYGYHHHLYLPQPALF